MEFSKTDERVIATLDEPFKSRFVTVANRVKERLKDDPTCYVVIRDGYRDLAGQMKEWEKGRTKILGKWLVTDKKAVTTKAKPGNSPHQYRRACHILLLDSVMNVPLGNKDPRWDIIGEEVERYKGNVLIPGLEWGGWWPMKDKVHIEDWHFRVLRKRKNGEGLALSERAPGELCPGFPE